MIDAINDPRAKHKCPVKRFEFINTMQTSIAGPNGSRINHATASQVFDVVQRLPEEHRHWGSAIRALQLILADAAELNAMADDGGSNVH